MKANSIEELKKLCLDIQDASNLSGVLHTWADNQQLIRTHVEQVSGEKPSLGADYKLHPAQILFLSKVISLMRVDADCIGGVSIVSGGETIDFFKPAYEWAKS